MKTASLDFKDKSAHEKFLLPLCCRIGFAESSTSLFHNPAFQTRPNFFWGKAVGEGSWKLWGTKDRLVGMHEEEYFINDKILPQRQTFRCQWWTVYGTLTFLILQVSLEIQHWMGGGATSGNRTNHKNVREQGYTLF